MGRFISRLKLIVFVTTLNVILKRFKKFITTHLFLCFFLLRSHLSDEWDGSTGRDALHSAQMVIMQVETLPCSSVDYLCD